jgi:tRNA dimethylallyltransferase
VAVVGPTASGKTDAAIALCQALGGEIVSMDSMQVYRGLDIGTAKPALNQRGGVPHYLLDVADPAKPFSVTEYRDLADAAIADILARDRLPVLAGGTGLYLNALTQPMDFARAPGDEGFRQALQEEALTEQGRLRLHARLAEVDAPTAARLHPNDARRVIRALEVHHATGLPMSAHARDVHASRRRYNPVILGLTCQRAALYARIDARVLRMVNRGLLEEVCSLAQTLPPDCQAMQAIGYRELLPVLRGEADLAQAVAAIQRNTRHYAKRQLTWFGHDLRVRWFDSGAYDTPQALHRALIVCVAQRIAEIKDRTKDGEDAPE